MKTQILLLEDDQLIAGGLIYALEQADYAVTHCPNVKEAKAAIQKAAYQCALLDMQLPDGLGVEVQAALKGTATPVIFLTVVDDEGNIVKAFEEGAADYITKPFRLRELLARVKRATLANQGRKSNILKAGGISVDIEKGVAAIDGEQLDLTALEYKLLLTFASNVGRTMTREQILDNLWDSSGNFVEDNTLTVYIKRLRQKLGDALTIQTVRGVGYRVD